MRKENLTIKAFRVYSGYNRKYFPLKLLQTLFDNASPYFILWMSSEIVTALYEGRNPQAIWKLVSITLIGSLGIRILSAVLGRAVITNKEILEIMKH